MPDTDPLKTQLTGLLAFFRVVYHLLYTTKIFAVLTVLRSYLKIDKVSTTKKLISSKFVQTNSIIYDYFFLLQVHQRELDDNLKLRTKREEERVYKEEVSTLSTKIGGLDLKQVLQEKADLKSREETILRDVSTVITLFECSFTMSRNEKFDNIY